MQLEQSFFLQGSPAELWPAFKDLELLVDCLPGASTNGPLDTNGDITSIPLRFEVRLGPIAAVFVGNGKLTPDDDTLSGSFEGSAVDRKTNSRVSGAAKFSLQAAQAPATGTSVTVNVDYSLAGSLAQFNRAGIVRQLADALTSEFASRLQEKISQSKDTEHDPAAESGPQTKPAQDRIADDPVALNPLTLVWSALRQKISRLITRINGKESS